MIFCDKYCLILHKLCLLYYQITTWRSKLPLLGINFLHFLPYKSIVERPIVVLNSYPSECEN